MKQLHSSTRLLTTVVALLLAFCVVFSSTHHHGAAAATATASSWFAWLTHSSATTAATAGTNSGGFDSSTNFHFDYCKSGHNWGRIAAEKTCFRGTQQSPISIREKDVEKPASSSSHKTLSASSSPALRPLRFVKENCMLFDHAKKVSATVSSDGHTIVVRQQTPLLVKEQKEQKEQQRKEEGKHSGGRKVAATSATAAAAAASATTTTDVIDQEASSPCIFVSPLDGAAYTLDGFTFRSGGEHDILGKRYPLELHFHFSHVAMNVQNLATIAVPFDTRSDETKDEGKNNENDKAAGDILHRILHSKAVRDVAQRGPRAGTVELEPPVRGPRKEIKETGGTTLLDLFPSKDDSYFQYSGSLTTPPCTEKVKWFVFASPVLVSHAIIRRARDLIDEINPDCKKKDERTAAAADGSASNGNARGLQQLNHRTILFFKDPMLPIERKGAVYGSYNRKGLDEYAERSGGGGGGARWLMSDQGRKSMLAMLVLSVFVFLIYRLFFKQRGGNDKSNNNNNNESGRAGPIEVLRRSLGNTNKSAQQQQQQRQPPYGTFS